MRMQLKNINYAFCMGSQNINSESIQKLIIIKYIIAWSYEKYNLLYKMYLKNIRLVYNIIVNRKENKKLNWNLL